MPLFWFHPLFTRPPFASHSSVPLLFDTPLRAWTRDPFLHFHMAQTRGALAALRRVSLQGREPSLLRCLMIRHPRRPPAPQIPHSEGGVPTSPSSSAPQRKYETRRPATTQRVTTSHPQSSMECPPTKKARTSGPSESSRASQPEPPVATHARALANSELPSDMSPGFIIRHQMLTTPPIEGNSDCRSRSFHSESYFD